MVLGPRFRKAEGAQRWAQGLLVARGRGLLTLPSLKTPFSFPYPEKHLGACRSAALLTRPCLPQTAGSPGCCSTAEIPPGRALRRGGAPGKEPGVRPVSLCRARRPGKIACNVGGEGDWSLWGEQESKRSENSKLNELPVPSAIKGNLKEFQFGDIINFPSSSSLLLQFRRVFFNCLLTL